jgi:hypothetical protein
MIDEEAIADSNRFGEYLFEREIVPRSALRRALGIQRVRQTPFGQLAILHALLNVHQVFEILGVEAETPHRVFGEIAQELGHLTHKQVDRILELQLETRPSLGEILVEMGIISAEDLARHLSEFEGALTN